MRAVDGRYPRRPAAVAIAFSVAVEEERERFQRWMTGSLAAFLASWALVAGMLG